MKRWVLVTGGTRGLGLAVVRRLTNDGFFVVAAARTCTAELRDHCNRHPESVEFAPLDLADFSSLYPFSKSFGRLGAPFALVNNAAIARSGVLGTMHESDVVSQVNVNITGTILLTKYISRLMLKRREGRIVNVSSIIAQTGFKGLSVYAATKAALNGFTKSLARELGAAGITVNSVAPGYMKTDMSSALDEEQLEKIRSRSALQRLATVDEVAGSISYLLSEPAAAITGTIVTIDAGGTA